jgi:hypothetical protein
MKAYERNQDKLHIMQQMYERLAAVPEADRSIEHMKEMLKLDGDIEKLEAKVAKLKAEASVTREEADANAVKAGSMMAAFVREVDIYFTAESGLWWYRQHGEWHCAKPYAFDEKFRGVIHVDASSFDLFQQEMDSQERKINKAFYSWDDKPGYLNLLNVGQFCQPVEANGYHAIFDLLLMALGGGKEENVEHLEKLIIGKWQHPENYLLPAVVFADGGGTGKSVLVAKYLPTIFGARNVADNLSIEQVFGKFNRSIAGKVIVFANEAPEDKGDDKGILRVVHSPMINIEAKGKDPIESVNTALYLLGTNPKSGGYAIRLAYNDVDRRFSIMHGTRPLKWYIAEAFKLSHAHDDHEGWLMMTQELQHVLSDPLEVGRWLYCKQRQYSDIASLKALHGADYQKQAKDSVEMHTRVCEAVFLDPNFEYIRSEVLFKLYEANKGSFKNIGFHRMVNVWLEQNPELSISYEAAWPWHDGALERRPKARVYLKAASAHRQANGDRLKLRANDTTYGQEENGRWSFYVDVI